MWLCLGRRIEDSTTEGGLLALPPGRGQLTLMRAIVGSRIQRLIPTSPGPGHLGEFWERGASSPPPPAEGRQTVGPCSSMTTGS